VIRVDAAWFAVEPLDMRAGVDKALARVVDVFGEARAHHAYLFVNKRANRMKVLVHDGFGLWLCARKLYEGSFIRAGVRHDRGMQLSHEQLQAIVVGLPWERLDERLWIIRRRRSLTEGCDGSERCCEQRERSLHENPCPFNQALGAHLVGARAARKPVEFRGCSPDDLRAILVSGWHESSHQIDRIQQGFQADNWKSMPTSELALVRREFELSR
jgi:transposase